MHAFTRSQAAVFTAVFLSLAGMLLGAQRPLAAAEPTLDLEKNQRVALVGNSLAERMNLFGHFETRWHLRNPEAETRFRNFGWPADEVGLQQRPNSYTTIDDPLKVFGPDLFLCFFGFNESFAGTQPEQIESFVQNYREYIAETSKNYARDNRGQFVLVSPTAFEPTGNPFGPDAKERNAALRVYRDAIESLAKADGHGFVDLFTPTLEPFEKQDGLQFTINGVHLNEAGDRLIAAELEAALFGSARQDHSGQQYERVRRWVNDKSWLHQQDYRMLNGWYVYGGRRTWDTETFPTEYRKIRAMVAVRDQYLWDLAAGRPVADQPDDSQTGDVVVPPTMFGTRDENFRKMREPEELVYPTPEESIKMMNVPEGFRVELFASEREFPELANPNQIAFDAKGRLWVSCMPNYPQWQPGAQRPDDRLLILEDTDNDGKADKCTTFYDKLICPTGFEFYDGGVLVVDEPRILFLKDHDGDDRADEVVQLIDGVATDDTHHTVGAWEFSPGGLLYMLEGVALSTTLETPWGAFRNRNSSGGYILDLKSMQVRHFRTPGYGNPWCLVFDRWGNGIVGDGTNARQHWLSPLTGRDVNTRKTLQPVFDNEGMRPAVGNEFLLSRHLPDDMQGQFIYACVINMHGMPRFNLRDQPDTAGFEGERVEDLLSSTDMIFRPVDPKIGPDGAIWFGDWCNALIGHMQYSQRDPNRDHTHGRVYRMVYDDKPLLETVDYSQASAAELLEALELPELRTRYRVRRELWERPKAEVYAALENWDAVDNDPQLACEAMWIQESFHDLRPELLAKILQSDHANARAAAIHTISNQQDRIKNVGEYFAAAVEDPAPRVRLEALRGISLWDSPQATEMALRVANHPLDYWIEYTLEHTLHGLKPQWSEQEQNEDFLADSSEAAQKYFQRYKRMSGPGGAAALPLEIADDVDADIKRRYAAIRQLAQMSGGNAGRGEGVFKQVCSSCHQVGDLGKKFGPDLTDIGQRFDREKIIRSITMPNEEIPKGYETVMVLTYDGDTHNGFILDEDEETLSLGIADGKKVDIEKDNIEIRKAMKASSMPEGLAMTIAPIEFLDLVAYLQSQKAIRREVRDGWASPKYLKAPEPRSRGEAVEVSQDAAVKLGPNFSNRDWNQESHLLLTASGREAFDFAFHSEHDASKPYVTIRLSEPRELSQLWLRNRLSRQFHQRATGLAVWVSGNGEDYEKVWSAEKPQAEWMVDFPAGTTAQYIRIGLEGQGTFHLYQAAVFGN
ncbi:PVC-type heme-binding CxxCH protein [Roseimaritima sediminicola]|uniref:PVC-type heme-binding CxxCH protein n=1 Tax=Roseimaritima sediminicola TaxID=2662066 RepID=UPI0012984767|nr:PVC-type heme-binding CxxCH protein [Roseimaritima sediminicola]